MKSCLRLFCLLSVCLAAPLATQVRAQEATLDAPAATDLPGAREIFQKHLDAIGDSAAIAKVKNQKMTGKISMPAMGINGTLEIIQVKPDKIATVMEMPQVGKTTQVFDGEVGWIDSAMMGMQMMTDEQIAQTKTQMAVETMQGFKDTFKKARVVAKAEFDGAMAYQMDATTKTDTEMSMFFDVETGLMRGMKMTAATPMGDMPMEIMMRDYKVTGPMKMSRTTVIKAGPTEMVMTIESVDLDVDVPEETFQRPADF
ncbi:MAG: hypothetical protein AAF802_21535 [Planctomycetota bacterium]